MNSVIGIPRQATGTIMKANYKLCVKVVSASGILATAAHDDTEVEEAEEGYVRYVVLCLFIIFV